MSGATPMHKKARKGPPCATPVDPAKDVKLPMVASYAMCDDPAEVAEIKAFADRMFLRITGKRWRSHVSVDAGQSVVGGRQPRQRHAVDANEGEGRLRDVRLEQHEHVVQGRAVGNDGDSHVRTQTNANVFEGADI